MHNLPDTAILFASDRHGIYIPQYFAESVDRTKLSNIPEEDIADLTQGPDYEYYWDVWDSVLNNAVLTDDNGVTYCMYQDGDLWLVPTDHDWDEE